MYCYGSVMVWRLRAEQEPQAKQDKRGAAKQHKAGLKASHDVDQFHS